MEVIKKCLDDFAVASGHRINLEKSRVFFSPNFNKEEALRICKVAAISKIEDFGKFLGSQLVHQRHQRMIYT